MWHGGRSFALRDSFGRVLFHEKMKKKVDIFLSNLRSAGCQCNLRLWINKSFFVSIIVCIQAEEFVGWFLDWLCSPFLCMHWAHCGLFVRAILVQCSPCFRWASSFPVPIPIPIPCIPQFYLLYFRYYVCRGLSYRFFDRSTRCCSTPRGQSVIRVRVMVGVCQICFFSYRAHQYHRVLPSTKEKSKKPSFWATVICTSGGGVLLLNNDGIFQWDQSSIFG